MVQLLHLYLTTEKNHNFDLSDLCKQSDVSAFLNMLSRFVIAFLPRNKHLLILLTILSDFEAQENKIYHHCFHFFPFSLPWSDGTRCHGLRFFNVKFLVSCFTLLFHPHQEALTSTIISFLDEAPGCMPRQSGSEPVLSPSSYVLCPFLTASPNIVFF